MAAGVVVGDGSVLRGHQDTPVMEQPAGWVETDATIQSIRSHTGKGWDGLTVGKGWYPLVKRAHTAILALYPDYEVLQIKEKFGTLRYYCSVDAEPKVGEIITAAEKESIRTCEDCGSTTDVKTDRNEGGFWIRTLCSKCRREET